MPTNEEQFVNPQEELFDAHTHKTRNSFKQKENQFKSKRCQKHNSVAYIRFGKPFA